MVFREIADTLRRMKSGLTKPALSKEAVFTGPRVVTLPPKEQVNVETLKQLIEKDPFNSLVLPKEMDLVVVDRGEITPVNETTKEKVSCKCGSCGGTSSMFSQRCEYCATEKPFLRLKREGEEYKKPAGESRFVSGSLTLSNSGDSAESPTVVYQQTGIINLDKGIHAPVLRSQSVIASNDSSIVFADTISFTGEESVTASEIHSQHVILGKRSHAGTVRVEEHGSYSFGWGTVIDTLQLDRSVEYVEPPFGVTVHNVVTGDFPVPEDLREFME